jgi:hypothetical protein
MNFAKKFWTPEESHDRGVLETALCLLSIKMSITTCVCISLQGARPRRHVKQHPAATVFCGPT